MSWHSENFTGAEEAVKQATQRAERSHMPFRIYLPKNDTKQVSFIDERAFSFMEHNYELNGKWGNYATCIGVENGCPWCLGKNNAYRVTLFTVIDHSVWADKKGNQQTDNKKILGVKESQALILRNSKMQWGRLKGMRVIITRGGERSASSGDSFSLCANSEGIIKTDWTKYPKEFLVPFEYEKIYGPKSIDEMRRQIAEMNASKYNGQGFAVNQNQGYAPQQQFQQPPQQQQWQQFQQPPQQQQWQQPPQQQQPQYQQTNQAQAPIPQGAPVSGGSDVPEADYSHDIPF